MCKFLRLLSVSVFLLAAAACSSDDGDKDTDGGTKTDTGTTTPPDKLDCGGDDCQGFVFSSLMLPADADQAKKFGVDFDGNGTADNQLGQILSALGQIVPDLALQPSVDEAVNQGSTIILIKVQGGDFKATPKAVAQAWLGKATTCCETKDDPVKCAEEAAAGCFGGSHEFDVDPAGPQDAIFGGSITGGKGKFGPSMFEINVPLSFGVLKLTLQQAQIEATFAGGKITGGKLAGGITEKDLNENVLPSVHKMLENTVENSEPDSSTVKQILQIFDADDDKKVTLEEVKDNDIIKAFLQGDVDVDGDGTPELSLGVGFEAVGATIKE